VRLAKAARTGSLLLPSLALAALPVFSGCGGGDSPETTAMDSTNSSAESGKDSAAGSGAVSQGKQSSGSANGKQGSNVSQPKGEPEPRITQRQRRKATTADITMASPAFVGGAVLPIKYTCDGENESPPLKWTGLPDEAVELVLFALNLNPVEEHVFFDWAVAGLDPSLEGIDAGKLPTGAVIGKNSFGKRGYSLCPPEAGQSESYIFMLYAIPKALAPKDGFDPLLLREEVLAQSGNVGLLSASYRRR
jgi:phosphatidylethanolamine-binding protein (PEBP) family uncharacterized protein